MLINNMKLGKSIEQKLKLRILFSVILLFLGGASLYVGTCVPLASGNADYSSGFYVGLGCGLIAAAIITIIKNVRLLKNKEALKQREIYESDERNRMIGLKCWSYAGYAMFILLYIVFCKTFLEKNAELFGEFCISKLEKIAEVPVGHFLPTGYQCRHS